jgi:peptidoglycan hydrolase-like protein with peptidoglycan-binding domain
MKGRVRLFLKRMVQNKIAVERRATGQKMNSGQGNDRRNTPARIVLLMAIIVVGIGSGADRLRAADAITLAQDVDVTPSLVREVQFMLLRLGDEPGPIDGVIGPQTTRAFHKFQEDAGLPVADIVIGGKISGTLLARLRSDASRAILGAPKQPETAPPAPPAPAVAPAPPAPPAPDRFAACPYNPADFRIGGTQYTPDKYLQEGFDGSTARAVSMLKDRLNEARQIASNIGGAALTEVQRQSRVLEYFSCRLKIEQAQK